MAELKKSMGLFGLSLYSAGIIIGAGVYSILGAAAGAAGEGLWLSFLMAAVVAGLTGLSYAELATALPKAGAEFVYAEKAFPRWPAFSFVMGFVLTVAACAAACTVALSFAGYLNSFIELPQLLVAFGVLLLCTGINLLGIESSSRVNIVFTLIEIAGLILVIALGISRPEAFAPVLNPQFNSGIFAGTALIFFVYLGFEDIANVAEETKDPGRNIPLAILISLVLTTILYVLIALAVMAMSTPEALQGSESPLLTAIQQTAPKFMGALGGVALFSTANTVLISLIAASRMLFGMARANAMPKKLSELSRRKSPWVAGLTVFVLSSIFLPFGKVEVVGAFSSAASLLAFGSVSLCLIVLRYREPNMKRPFRVPLAIGKLPVIPILALLTTAALGFYFEAKIYLITGVMLMVALSAYFAWQKLGKRTKRRH